MLPNWWAELKEDLQNDLEGLQVAVYASGGSPFHHLTLAALWGANPIPVRAEDIHDGLLDQIDILIFPGGGFTAMTGMLTPLGVAGAKKVKEWVKAGGMYLGSCAGSFLPAYVGEAYWAEHEEAKALHMVSACLANSSNSIFEGLSSPGVGTLKASVTQPKHWLTRNLPASIEIIHYNGPLFDLAQHTPSTPNLPKPEGILKPIAASSQFTPSEGFMAATPKETLLEQCIQKSAYNAIVSPFGKGQVVLFGSHPEFGFDAIQLGWGEASGLLANAFRFQAKKQKASAQPIPIRMIDATAVLKDCSAMLERITTKFTDLHTINTNAWLEGEVPSFLGMNAKTLWKSATSQAAKAAKISSILSQALSEKEHSASIHKWLDNEPLENQDVGFMGLRQLLQVIETQLDLATKQLRKTPISLQHAYDGFEVHPYQIAASSYLSAAGLTASAHLLSVTIAKLNNNEDLIPFDLLLHQ